MDLAKLRHFVAVAQLLSFARAAEQLHISQPALSRSIQAIERSYQVRLFDRDRSGVELTAAGRLVLPRAVDLLMSAEVVGLEIDAIAQGISGSLSFGIGGGAAETLVPEALVDLIRGFPQVKVAVHIGSYALLAARLDAGDDEFFLGRPGNWSPSDGSEVELIGSSTPMLLVRPGHPLLRSSDVDLAELAAFTIMASPEWNRMLAKLPHRHEREVLRASIVLDELSALVTVARRTDSILAGSLSARAGGLVPLRIGGGVLEQPALLGEAGIFTARDRTLSPAAELVIETMRSHAYLLLAEPVRA